MYGDTTRIRGLADDLRERAAEIRTLADRLVAQADAVAWEGLAADAMRHHTRERAGALQRTAWLHDEAADALDRHARQVDFLTDLIASIEDKARGLVDRFVPPLPGSREWLSVSIPGLS